MKLLKDKGFIIGISLYIVLFLADMITTLMNYKLLKAIETNPIYNQVGLTGIILLNILIIGLIIYTYNKGNVNKRFIIMNVIVTTCFVRMIAVRNAISWIGENKTLEQATVMATPALKAQTSMTVLVLSMLPLLLGVITYYLWKIDHEVIKKGVR